jgi:hemoglobin
MLDGGTDMTSNARIDRRRTLLGAAALGAGVAIGASGTMAPAAASGEPATAGTGAESQTGTPEPSLYERLGGIFAIAAVVNRFSDQIIINPKLNRNPALVAWNEKEAPTRLPGLKFMRTLWVAALAGGPFAYTGLPLHDAHLQFHLTPEEFDEVGAEIVRALDYYHVPEREKKELVDAYMQSKPEVVSASP